MAREARHMWVGNVPENMRGDNVYDYEHFKRYECAENIKVLPNRGSECGVEAFVDTKSAQKAHNSVNIMGDRYFRMDYNEPRTTLGAAPALGEKVSIASCSREASGFRGGGEGPTYRSPQSRHAREGHSKRRLLGASDTWERSSEHSAYGHPERGTGASRHQDHYGDSSDKTLQHGIYYNSRQSPSRSDAHESYNVSWTREQSTLPSVEHRDIYRNDVSREIRGRRPKRSYQRRRSRSPRSCRSRSRSPRSCRSRSRSPRSCRSRSRSPRSSRSRSRSPRSSRSRSRSPRSSRSRNRSRPRLARQASTPARSSRSSSSRSRSSSSDSRNRRSSSTSSDSSRSSSCSGEYAAVPQPPHLDKRGSPKSFGIKVQNLPVRSTDTSLKDGLFHAFKKYGKVSSVQIHGASEERYGLVFFKQWVDQGKALDTSKDTLFFGQQIEVTPWEGSEPKSEIEFRPLQERIDKYHPKASRTLFVGNLEKTTTHADLEDAFERFGEIVDIEVKNVKGVPQYAFLQYGDITSVCKAIKKMDGEYLGMNRLKLGFGRSKPTNCVWVDGLSSSVTEQDLTCHFSRYGLVLKVVYDRFKGMAMILYNEITFALEAVNKTKGRKIGGKNVMVDFGNPRKTADFSILHGQDILDKTVGISTK